MTKPDWAERLQRTFKRKYEQGFAKGYDEGFNDGSTKALHEFRKVVVKKIQALPEYKDNPESLSKIIDFIRKGK